MLKLSQRLLTLARMIPCGTRVADIGTDHALLPCYLIKENISPYVIGVEANKKPYKKACFTVEQYNLQEKIAIRLGNGLAVLKPGEVNTVVLAGMGGPVICDILEKSPQVLASLDKIIVQPMRNAEIVRFWLVEHGWLFSEEELIYEDKQYYQIIGAKQREPGEGVFSLNEAEAAYGPLLIKKRHVLLSGLVEKDLAGWQEILGELAKSKKKETKRRVIAYQEKMQKFRELQEWLEEDKGGL
ncbi:MAG: class I SAM-dependent methyltransferase [Clostridia bacterium]|nr:class I SAM-dependent methyltransferase [Clostridia bacterium]MDD4665878.1 class I SAM-dependent methyltransferase [Clostridia bacterium]